MPDLALGPPVRYASVCDGIGAVHAAWRPRKRLTRQCKGAIMREAVRKHGFPKQRRPLQEINVSKAIVVAPEHLVKRISGRKGSPALADAMYAAYAGGASLSEVAAAFGRTRQSVYATFKRRGWALRPQVRFGADNNFYRGGSLKNKPANHKVEKAVKSRCLSRQACQQCASSDTVYAHHDDYTKPLVVRWLCVRCHFEWHQHNKAIPAMETSCDI